MKLTFTEDRIQWRAESEMESEAIRAIHELMFFPGRASEDVVNDSGIRKGFNFCSTPLPMSVEESEQAITVSHN